MSASLILAALISAWQPDPTATATAQVRPVQATVSSDSQDDPVDLGEIVVEGRRLDDLVRNFVGEVAAPNDGRGLARWDRRLCVGVVNLRRETAEYIADRISTVAEDLGVGAGDPGCEPNVLVVATSDGRALARTMVDERPRAFRRGGSGMDQGRGALRDFVETDKPIRWWQVSLPVDSETGGIATSIPGVCRPPCDSPMAYAPIVKLNTGSRLRTQIVDHFYQSLIIVEIDRLGHLTVPQLADYLAMVSMAQIDPQAETSNYASILNVVDNPEQYTSLTEWDQAYLAGLYSADQSLLNRRANSSEVSRSILRAHRQLQETDDAKQ